MMIKFKLGILLLAIIDTTALTGQVTRENTKSTFSPVIINTDQKDTARSAPTSNIDQVKNPDKKTLQIYPTPVRNNATLSFWVKKDSYITIYLLDITGIRVKNLVSAYYNQGWKSETVSTSNLMPGRYILVFQSNDEKKVLPFVILR